MDRKFSNVNQNRNTNFIMIYEVLEILPSYQFKALAAMLKTFGWEGVCSKSIKTLAKEARMSEKQFRRSIEGLKKGDNELNVPFIKKVGNGQHKNTIAYGFINVKELNEAYRLGYPTNEICEKIRNEAWSNRPDNVVQSTGFNDNTWSNGPDDVVQWTDNQDSRFGLTTTPLPHIESEPIESKVGGGSSYEEKDNITYNGGRKEKPKTSDNSKSLPKGQIYEFLKPLKIEEGCKYRLMRFPEENIKKSIEYVFGPTFKVDRSLEGSLMHYSQYPDRIPISKEAKANKREEEVTVLKNKNINYWYSIKNYFKNTNFDFSKIINEFNNRLELKIGRDKNPLGFSEEFFPQILEKFLEAQNIHPTRMAA